MFELPLYCACADYCVFKNLPDLSLTTIRLVFALLPMYKSIKKANPLKIRLGPKKRVTLNKYKHILYIHLTYYPFYYDLNIVSKQWYERLVEDHKSLLL